MPISAALRDRLALATCLERVRTDPADTWVYGYDNSRKHAVPDAVVFATTHREVRDVVQACFDAAVPLIARGRGTGTTGAAIPLHGGVVLSLERMNRILSIDPANRVLVVEPGVTNQAIQEAAAIHGFFWPPDPTSAAYCTVGGNLAVNAAGPHAVKYGSTRENTLGLRAVIGTGDEIHTGAYTTKGAVGYDLTRLLIGSEGTLAIITEATLKLTPLPESRRLLQVIYSSVRDAAQAISRIMAQPATPCALEFMDANAINMVREYAPAVLPDNAGALLLIEVDGPEQVLDDMVAAIRSVASGHGLLDFRAARTRQESDALWSTRKALSPALRNIAPNKLNEDVVVPVSRLPELIEGLDRLSRAHGIPIVNFGHAGNGNIHVNLLYDSQDPKQAAAAKPCLRQVFDLVLQLGGTLSGEHGIGQEKRDYIPLAIDPVALDLMRRIKTQFDPKGILNPDKIFPHSPK
ncbi:MAG TPA: FAD-binding oxidoreductase [Gammaproteobacteria bacterium]|nr:FAD-binding oxidoreductase [Gammaproteobacteria bacterium]